MNLLCCIVTHNRSEYSRRTIESWLATAGRDDRLVVFDNASDDGTRDWLPGYSEDATIILSDKNLFPGAAVNRGWHEGLKHHAADLLMRSDNDIEYLSGWRDEVERAYLAFPELGQLGLLNMHEDYAGLQPVTRLERDGYGVNVQWPTVGGNCVIRRKLWDDGFRWTPGAWRPGGQDEDTVASLEIKQRGLLVARLVATVANNLSFHRYDDYPDYYTRTANLRGLVPELSV